MLELAKKLDHMQTKKLFLFPYDIIKIYQGKFNTFIIPSSKKLYLHLSRLFPSATFIIMNFEQQINTINTDQIIVCQPVKTISLSWGVEFKSILESKNYQSVILSPKIEYQNLAKSRNTKESTKKWDYVVGLTDLHAFIPFEKSLKNYNSEHQIDKAILRYRTRSNWAKRNVETFLSEFIPYMHANPSRNAVLKPHPLVSKFDYENLLSSLNLQKPNNIYFSNARPQELLRNASTLITNYSTLCFDARILNCNVYSWLPEPLPDFMQLNWLSFVPKLNFESLQGDLEMSASSQYSRLDEYIGRNFFNNEANYSNEIKDLHRQSIKVEKYCSFDTREYKRMLYFFLQYMRRVTGLIEAKRLADYTTFKEQKHV